MEGLLGRPMVKRSCSRAAYSNGFQIFVMNRDGTAVRQLSDAAGEFVNTLSLVSGVSGRKHNIVRQAAGWDHPGRVSSAQRGDWGLWLIPVASAKLTFLAPPYDIDDKSVAWNMRPCGDLKCCWSSKRPRLVPWATLFVFVLDESV